jgi:DNA polymerase III delta subunit
VPGNQQQLLSYLLNLKTEPPEVIFTLLHQRLRQLIIAKELGKTGLKNFNKRLQDWQQARLINQAARFDIKQLKRLYRQLLAIDTKIKTGRTLTSLDCHLDFLIASL